MAATFVIFLPLPLHQLVAVVIVTAYLPLPPAVVATKIARIVVTVEVEIVIIL